MPELPEVETVVRGLVPHVVGRVIRSAETRRADLRFPFGDGFCATLAGQRVDGLTRRAKYLVLRLGNGAAVIMHLGMSGRLTFIDGADTETPGHYMYGSGTNPAHDHVVFDFGGGRTLVYNDPRRFGFMLLVEDGQVENHALMRHLGVEPLGNAFNAAYLAEAAKRRSVSLKALLMDQTVVAGIGNIYASEALHVAGLSPRRVASSLSDRNGKPTIRAMRLVAAIRTVLDKAIDAGGSTLRDYRNAEGGSGQFQEQFRAYDRDGEACPTQGCTGKIRRLVQQGRATFYCGTCQK